MKRDAKAQTARDPGGDVATQNRNLPPRHGPRWPGWARRAAKSPDILLSVFLSAGLTFALWETRDLSGEARLVPFAVGLGVLVLTLVQLGRETIRVAGSRSDSSSDILDLSFDSSQQSSPAMQRGSVFVAWLLALLVGIWLLGFMIAVPAYVFFYLKTQARASWRLTFFLTACMLVFELGLYDQILNTRWPAAAIAGWIPFMR